MHYPQEHIKPYNTNEEKVVQVEHMFDYIAPTYDKLNHTLSWGIDRRWRKKAIRRLKPLHPQSILDVATGTGDFAIQSCQQLKPKELVGIDISEGMMKVAAEKIKEAGLTSCISLKKEDCTKLSFSSNRFDAITVAFGIRNFESLDTALKEMHRVLRKGGKLVILELSQPEGFLMKRLYAIYSTIIIPTIGRIFSKDRQAYHYLPDSIKAFPQGEVMSGILKRAGFKKVRFNRLTFGICTLYVASK